MADGHGGYRAPAHPAPVSGPGAMSQRTDGRQAIRDLPDAKYGENAAFRAAEGAAPMSGGGPMAQAAGPNLSPDLSGIVGLADSSQRPDESIMAGMPMGAGAGSTGSVSSGGLTPEQADRLRSYLPVLVLLASQDDTDPATKSFVRRLRGELG